MSSGRVSGKPKPPWWCRKRTSAEPLLWDYVVTDFQYVQRMGGVNPDPSVVHGLPDWLTDTVIPVEEIEAFKVQLKDMGMA